MRARRTHAREYQITSDSYILDLVAHAHLKFTNGPPPPNPGLKPYVRNEVEKAVVDNEISALLYKGVIVEVPETISVQYVRNLLLRYGKY